MRQHLTLHPEFSFLPRKFKIAVSAAEHDRAAVKVHDLGLRLHRNGAGEVGFEVMVGGGLGRTPFIAKTIKPFLPKRDVLSYVEAVLRLYNQYGRRDNIYKARIKILVHDKGAEAFGKEVDAEWQSIKDGALALDPAVVADIATRFSYPDYPTLTEQSAGTCKPRARMRPSRPGSKIRSAITACRATPSSRCRSSRSASRRAMRPPTRWTRSPTSPTATASAKSASATSKISCCRMSRSAICRKCGAHSTRSSSRRRTSG